MTPPFTRVVVAGAAGGFGGIFTTLLTAEGCAVTAVDNRRVDTRADGSQPGGTDEPRWLVADAAAPSEPLVAELRQADLLIACLPENALFAGLAPLLRELPAGALVVDTTSVKSRYAEQVLGLRPDLELLSLEPMFAPDVGFAGQDVVVVALRDGPAASRFRPLLTGLGARLVELDVRQHDQQAAITQVAVHAALLAYGGALTRLGEVAGQPTTALQRAFRSLLARVVSRDPAVYWHIQRDNPFAGAARAAVRQALAELDAIVAGDDPAAFADLFESVTSALGPDAAALAARSGQLLEPATPRAAPRQ